MFCRSRVDAQGDGDDSSLNVGSAATAGIGRRQSSLNNTQPIAGLSSITQEHADILSALTIKKPTLNTQLTLL